MTSTGSALSLKRRDSSVTREGEQLIITPLGASNEVGQSCVHVLQRKNCSGMLWIYCLVSFKYVMLLEFSSWLICNLKVFYYLLLLVDSLTAESILLTRAWLLCLTLMRLIPQQLMCFLLYPVCSYFLSFSFWCNTHAHTYIYFQVHLSTIRSQFWFLWLTLDGAEVNLEVYIIFKLVVPM